MVKLAPDLSGTAGSDLRRLCTIPADQPRLAVSVRAAKSLQAALLTDAQLVSDGHSPFALNGARVKMKAGGPFMYKPSSWSTHFLLSVFPLS